ncbi:MAG: heparinase II/III family protein, partial [Phycisphaerae bacterium]
PDALKGWTVNGPVSVDESRGRTGAALKIEPGGVALWKLRDTEGAGAVDMWVYEDMTVPADPKKRRVSPRWGLLAPGPSTKLGTGGKALVVGPIYAPYLNGQTTYAASDYQGDTWFNVTYLGECRRKEGWRRWTFTMDPAKGLSIAMDGKDVNARRKRFDWNKTKFTGMLGVAIFGDSEKAAGQTIWVDDVTVTLGGPMTAKPVPPPPPPPVVPDKDPPAGKTVQLVEAVRGRHPRLLFSAEDVPAMRKFAQGKGKWLFEKLVEYLPVCKAPDHTKFLTDGTDAQRQGFWRAPTAGLHYVLTGEKQSLEQAVSFLKLFAKLKHWEEGAERDSGMGAANIMVGAALAYDWCHDALEPDFRETVRRKLLWHARAMYHGGHLMKNRSATQYWQQDPQNNHRWHRDAGLALCALAACSGKPEEQWILEKTLEELKFVHDWLPPDGTSHEGPSYHVFGGNHLTIAMHAADRCLGTKYLQHPFFSSAPLFRIHTLTPGLTGSFCFGDGGGLGGYHNFLYKCCAAHRLADAQATLRRFNELNPSAFDFAWFSLVWMDGEPAEGSGEKLAKTGFFGDLGLLLVRDGWDAGNVGAMFKCGPYGGYKLNEYRNARDFHYVNVAHDDPDVNSFLLYARGAMLAETSRYSKKKLTSSHNTILINGKGQRGDGQGWTQPLGRGDKDMTKLGVVTAFKDAGDVVVVEGEGAGAYPDLTRYRRTFIWVKGAYVLILDDIRAEKDVELSWLIQGPKLTPLDRAKDHYILHKDEASCELHVVAQPQLSASLGVSTADHRGKPLGWKQLRLKGKGKRFRVVSAYDAWARGDINVNVIGGDEAETLNVTAKGVADAWTWQPPGQAGKPSRLVCKRGGQVLAEIGEKDLPPKP